MIAPACIPHLIPRQLARFATSLLIGAVGGFLFNAAKFPAGWLAGAMVFAAVAALAGGTIQVPAPLARGCSIVLGITLGGTVTPATLRGITAWPLSIAMVMVSVAAATLATVTYLQKIYGWGRLTAIFAAMPGGLAQVMALASEEGRDCDIRGIAIVQTLRVIILAVVVPAALALTGMAGACGCRRTRPPSRMRRSPSRSWSALPRPRRSACCGSAFRAG